MFKFVHCADLHLDSPLRGLSLREDAPAEAIRSATRRALDNLVELCIEEDVRFLVIAGDVFDGDWQDYSTGLFFNACMTRLTTHDIRVYIVSGNHDAASTISRKLLLPSGVHRFSSDQPETFVIDDLQVALHGQGFKDRIVTQNLVPQYPLPVPGYFNIGVLHTSLEGHEGHETYAPCTVHDLTAKGYDYWALGHVHKRQVIRDTSPCIVYPGNLQGRHIRETGDKGCTLVTVDSGRIDLQHRSLDVLRWALCEVDLTGTLRAEDMVGRVMSVFQQTTAANPGYPLALRIRLTGQTALHGSFLAESEYYLNEIVNAAQQSAIDRIWVEKVIFDTQGEETGQSLPDRTDAISELDRIIQQTEVRPEFLELFASEMQTIQMRMPDYLRSEGSTVIASAEEVRELVSDARDVLVAMLARGGGQP